MALKGKEEITKCSFVIAGLVLHQTWKPLNRAGLFVSLENRNITQRTSLCPPRILTQILQLLLPKLCTA
jgi:hypothetical protein